MPNNPHFTVEYLDEAVTFLRTIDPKATRKMLQTIEVAAITNDPKKFKKLEHTEIWEFRIEMNRLQYRLFAFWDNRRQAIVIATHGIIKKQQKTPKKEIERAERIRLQYFNNTK